MACNFSSDDDFLIAGRYFYDFIKKAFAKRNYIWSSKKVTIKSKKNIKVRLLRRGPLENIATAIIGLGVFMLMQPFSIFLYSHSFKFILFGTLAFVVVSHFPDE